MNLPVAKGYWIVTDGKRQWTEKVGLRHGQLRLMSANGRNSFSIARVEGRKWEGPFTKKELEAREQFAEAEGAAREAEVIMEYEQRYDDR